MAQSRVNGRTSRHIRVLTALLSSVVLIWLLYGFFSMQIIDNFFGVKTDDKDKWETRGLFGDTFGSLNALFSGLAFAGVIYTILLQREELELQREEIRNSIQAQRASELALAQQIDEMRKQTGFEEGRNKKEVSVRIIQDFLSTYYLKNINANSILGRPPDSWTLPDEISLCDVANWFDVVSLLYNTSNADVELIRRAGIDRVISSFYTRIAGSEVKKRLQIDTDEVWKEMKYLWSQNYGG